ncbi:MAG: hypothetical protein WD048_03195 [Chitinophagales bacterium]
MLEQGALVKEAIIEQAYQSYIKNDQQEKPSLLQLTKMAALFMPSGSMRDWERRSIIKAAMVFVWCEDWGNAYRAQSIFFDSLKNFNANYKFAEEYLYLCFIIDANDILELFSYYGWLEHHFEDAYEINHCVFDKWPEWYYEDNKERVNAVAKFKGMIKKYGNKTAKLKYLGQK